MRGLSERGIVCVLGSRSARVQTVIALWTTAGRLRRTAQHRLEADRAASSSDGPHRTLARAVVDAKCNAMLELLNQHQRKHNDLEISIPFSRVRVQVPGAVAAYEFMLEPLLSEHGGMP
jgi:hypothetical protein